MTNEELLIRDLLTESKEDYVGLWSVHRQVKKVLSLEGKAARDKTLSLLALLLREGRIVAGSFVGRNFAKWERPVDEILSRIEIEWHALDRDPDIGKITWLISP